MNLRLPRSVAGVGVALGAGVFAVVSALCFVISWLTAWSLGASLGSDDLRRLTAIQVALFHRSGVRFQAEPLPDASLDLVLTGAEMLGTVAVVWLAFKAGSMLVSRSGMSAAPLLQRASVGSIVGLVYGSLCAVATLLASGFPLPLGSGSVGVVWGPGIVWPFILGVLGSTAGAVAVRADGSSADGDGRGRGLDRIAGGWRMTSWALLGSFVAMLVVAGLDPSYSRVYFAGVRMARSDRGVAAATHNILLIPNASAWATTAAMGGCISSTGSVRTDLVCVGRLATGADPEALVATDPDLEEAAPEGSAPFPLVLLVFALVPPVATVAGGIRAGRGSTGRAEAARSGALAGLVFCATFTAVAWFSGVAVTGSPDASLLSDLDVAVGPVVWSTALLAAVWGLVGGTLGSLAGVTVRRRAQAGRRGGSAPLGEDDPVAGQPG